MCISVHILKANTEGGYNIDPIKWRVLSNSEKRLFVISDMNLDCKQYHDKRTNNITWEGSASRAWLNGTFDGFLHDAFESGEQGTIADTLVRNDLIYGFNHF